MSVMCRHRQRNRANRPRGLCWTCYYTPAVSALYPSTSKFARRGVPDGYGRVSAPAAPTSAPPGSPEKVAVLVERAALRQSLWHARDACADPERPSGDRRGIRTVSLPPDVAAQLGDLTCFNADPERLLRAEAVHEV